MSTVVLDVGSLQDTLSDTALAMDTGIADVEAHISFATPELLLEVLTADRWSLLKAVAGAGPISIADTAQRVGRAEHAVRADAEALLQAGVLNTAGDDLVELPYDTVKVELLLRAA